jgi:hypothetical protein
MTDDTNKVPYIQCLKHTGKKVYGIWLIILGVISVIIGLGLVITIAWQQINDGFKYIGNCLGYIWNGVGYILSTISSLFCSIPWYWWVGIGVIIGPSILVAIYCALKHFNITSGDITGCVLLITIIVSYIGAFNFLIKLFFIKTGDFSDIACGCISLMWLAIAGACLSVDVGDTR